MKQRNKKAEAEVKTNTKTVVETENGVLNFLKTHTLLVTIALIAFIAFFVFKDFLLCKKAMLYKDIGSDTLNASYPLLLHISNYIHSFGMPSWSFNYGMGQSIFPFMLRDPFDIFLYFLSKNSIAFGIGYVEFFKVIIAGTFFYLYLKQLGIALYSAIIGALLYSFTGFMILGGGWYIFSFEALNAALLLLAFEKLYKNNSLWLFPIPIALIGISMPFNLYLYGLFISVYALLRFYEERQTVDIKQLLVLVGKIVVLGLIGLAISSFFLFENIIQLIESPRGSGGNSYTDILTKSPIFSTGDLMHNATAILRFFSSDILGTGINFKGWNNYLEAPIFYSGILSLLLFPQVFPFLTKRTKFIYAFFLLFWILPIVFPYFRYAFWLFTGDYYRAFSFFVSFTLIYLSVKSLNFIELKSKINVPILIATLIILLVALSYPYFEGATKIPIDKAVMNFAKIILFVYATLVFLKTKNIFKNYTLPILLIVVCIELGYMSNITVNKRSIVTANELKEKIAYNDYTNEAIAFIKKNDSSFYRVDKNYASTPAIHSSLNDGLAQNYYGTSSYYSFNQMHYIEFLKAVGIVNKNSEIESRWASGLANRPVLESFGSVKYFLDRRNDNPTLRVMYDSINQFGNIKVFKNKFFIPLGFTLNKSIEKQEFEKLPPTQKDFVLLQSFVVNEKDEKYLFPKFNLKDTLPQNNYSWEVYRSFVENLKKDTLAISEHFQTSIKGSIQTKEQKMLLLTIPYDKGWQAKVDGQLQEIKIVDAGFSGLLLAKGNHTIELNFRARYTKIGLIVSTLSIGLYLLLLIISRRKKKAETLLPT